MSKIYLDRNTARRVYFVGDTYNIREKIKAIGGKWDADRKTWWVGTASEAKAQSLIEGLGTTTVAANQNSGNGDSTVVAGRASYKGRPYYCVASWRGECATTRDGTKVLLASLDGSIQFWAPRESVGVEKTYRNPRTIKALREYAASAAKGLSFADYKAEIEMLEDQDYFAEAEQMERGGYTAWKQGKEQGERQN